MLVQRNGLDSTESTEPSHSGVELLLQSETSFGAPAPDAVSCQKVCDPAGGSWDRMGQSPRGGGGADWSRASFCWSLFSGQTGVGGRGPPLFLKALCSSDLSFLSGGWKVPIPPTPAVCVCVRVPHTPSSSPHTPSCNYASSSCLFGSGRRNLAQHSYPVNHCLQA